MNKKKICMILPNNIYLAPYVRRYISILSDCAVDLIYWDRFDLNETLEGVYGLHRYIKIMPLSNVSQLEKFRWYIGFAQYTKKNILSKKYDGYVVFQPMMLIILSAIMPLRRLKNLVVDVRDFTYEGSGIFRKVEAYIFHKCNYVVISSQWYKEFLPAKTDYAVMQNINRVSDEAIHDCRTQNKTNISVIKIGFVGLIRFAEQNNKIITKFANDTRFELEFIGKGSELLKDFVESNHIANVKLLPQFDPSQTEFYFSSIDIILNMYGSGRDKLKYALSNKLYYAAMLGKPILVSPATCMQKVTEQYGFGLACDENDDRLADKVFAYFHGIDWNEFYDKCDCFLKSVSDDDELMMTKIRALAD